MIKARVPVLAKWIQFTSPRSPGITGRTTRSSRSCSPTTERTTIHRDPSISPTPQYLPIAGRIKSPAEGGARARQAAFMYDPC